MQFILASAQLRRWYLLRFREIALPRRPMAPGLFFFHGLALRRGGIVASAPGLTTASQQARASYVLSAVTDAIGSSAGIWSSRFGRTEASPTPLPVTLTARISNAAASTARCTLHHTRRLAPPCSRACHLPLATDLDAGAVHEQVQRSARALVRRLHGQRLLTSAQRREVRHRPVQPRELQSLATKPVVCRSGSGMVGGDDDECALMQAADQVESSCLPVWAKGR